MRKRAVRPRHATHAGARALAHLSMYEAHLSINDRSKVFWYEIEAQFLPS